MLLGMRKSSGIVVAHQLVLVSQFRHSLALDERPFNRRNSFGGLVGKVEDC